MALEIMTLGTVCADVMAHPVGAMPARGTLGFVDHLDLHLGGLAGVAASVASDLGAKTGIIARVGRDPFGDFLLQQLNRHNVSTDWVVRSATMHTSATVVIIDAAGERTFLHTIGANAELCEDDVPWEALAGVKVLHWAGPSLTPKLDRKPIARVLARAREAGIATSVDTVFDGSGTWGPLLEPALGQLDLVFSNKVEAGHYTKQREPEAMADYFLQHGAKIAVIKMGEQGLLAKDGQTTVRLPAHEVSVVDTTGAGDAACGAFLYGYCRGWDTERCARLANAAGGLTVGARGGAEAGVTLEAALELMENAHV